MNIDQINARIAVLEAELHELKRARKSIRCRENVLHAWATKREVMMAGVTKASVRNRGRKLSPENKKAMFDGLHRWQRANREQRKRAARDRAVALAQQAMQSWDV